MNEADFLRLLLAPPKRKSNSTVRLQKSSGGSFVGKAGSIRRNSKGGTRRLANGRRQFIPTLETWHRLGLSKDTMTNP